MAKKQGAKLVFVFAVDTDFLNKTAAPILVDVVPEIENMAEFLLLMAQERAAKEGVEADTVAKVGKLRDVLLEAAAEREASLIVLGRPAEESHFPLEGLEAFADDLREASGIDVQIV